MELKELLGEELYKQVQTKIDEKNSTEADKLKHVRYADLSEGKYVSKEKYDSELTPFEEAEGYTVVIPDLPGCVTEGHDLTNATEMAIDAAGGWVLDELENGHAVPDSSSPASITVPEGSFMNMITLNIPE
mgnify:CR=1 FL=1|jgi:predicted RNase H-like HicB family nuclease